MQGQPVRNTASLKCLSKELKGKPSSFAIRCLYKTCKIMPSGSSFAANSCYSRGNKPPSCFPNQHCFFSFKWQKKKKLYIFLDWLQDTQLPDIYQDIKTMLFTYYYYCYSSMPATEDTNLMKLCISSNYANLPPCMDDRILRQFASNLFHTLMQRTFGALTAPSCTTPW